MLSVVSLFVILYYGPRIKSKQSMDGNNRIWYSYIRISFPLPVAAVSVGLRTLRSLSGGDMYEVGKMLRGKRKTLILALKEA